MVLSSFFKWIKVSDNEYAIFNTLIMDVLYVQKKELIHILNAEFDKLDLKLLKQACIVVEDNEMDEKALDCLKYQFSMNSKKIAIMYLIVSSGCNLGCRYCFIDNNENNNSFEMNMSLDVLEEAVHKYLAYIEAKKIEKPQILFYGGEPLLNFKAIKYAVEIVNASEIHVDYCIVTNGTLLTDEVACFLAENNFSIGISLDGPKDINDFNRIFRQSSASVYDNVCKSVSLLKKYNANFGLSLTVSEYFLKHKDDIFSWLKEFGVKNIFYNLFHYTYYEPEEVWRRYYENASNYLIKSHEVLSVYGVVDGRLNRKIESIVENKFKFADCAAIGANQVTIKPNGDVCVCHGYLKTDKYVIGNIRDKDFDFFANSEEFEFWKERSTLYNDKCLSCEALFACGGGCPTQAEALYGSRKLVDEPFCIHTKKTLKWLLECGAQSSLEDES